MIRSGIGYDIHPLKEERNLILGGVNIPYIKGLSGYSDADVLIHAIIDSILGAMGEGDIGRHFPDNDPQYKGISSLKLLEKTHTLLLLNRYSIINIDSVIIADKPRLQPYLEQMRSNIAQVLNMTEKNMNVKACSNEGLGFIGRGEGIAAYAVSSIKRQRNKRNV